jgi:hypothetical protein
LIHYHGLPMSGAASDMVKAFAGRHAMVSYETPEPLALAAEICKSVVLDNGAFSAWKAGRAYDFGGYVAWVTKWLKHPAVEWCIIPDIIDGGEGANDMQLHKWFYGLNGIPVYHMHESLGRLERLVKRYPRVALGSSGQWDTPNTDDWWARMSEMMAVACDADGIPHCKFHGLRMLDTRIFSHLPLASADSVNVSRNVGYDERWHGPYPPKSKWVKALVLMDRIENHACAARWCGSNGVQHNMELVG